MPPQDSTQLNLTHKLRYIIYHNIDVTIVLYSDSNLGMHFKAFKIPQNKSTEG
jgi:hypothetical protein